MKIVKLYAEWCGPCKILEKRMQDLNVNYTNIDIESSEGDYYVETYDVSSVPTLLVFDDYDNLLNKSAGVPSTIEELKRIVYNE